MPGVGFRAGIPEPGPELAAVVGVVKLGFIVVKVRSKLTGIIVQDRFSFAATRKSDFARDGPKEVRGGECHSKGKSEFKSQL